MLFNPKWTPATATKPADIFSLASLIAWLETQDPTREYDERVPDMCVMGQFARAMGVSERQISQKSCELTAIGGSAWTTIASGRHARGPHTFGAALSRARALVAS